MVFIAGFVTEAEADNVRVWRIPPVLDRPGVVCHLMLTLHDSSMDTGNALILGLDSHHPNVQESISEVNMLPPPCLISHVRN
jgi:hypothetical protein